MESAASERGARASTPGPRPALDAVDRKLIAELIADGRATYAALSQHVGLSQAATRVRVRRLLDERIVTVSARIDPRTLGAAVFGFALVRAEGPIEAVAERIGRLREAVFVVGTSGRPSLLVELRCRDDHHLLHTLDALRGASGVAECETLEVIEYIKQGWAGLAQEVSGHAQVARSNPVPARRALDDHDRRLVELLTHDGRATYAALAPTVGLSQAGVRARVRQLVEDGIVVIQAFATAETLEISAFSAVFVGVRGPAVPVATRLARLPQTTIVAATSGRFDLACEVWCREQSQLLETIEQIRSIEGVARVESATYLRVFKEQYEVNGS